MLQNGNTCFLRCSSIDVHDNGTVFGVHSQRFLYMEIISFLTRGQLSSGGDPDWIIYYIDVSVVHWRHCSQYKDYNSLKVYLSMLIDVLSRLWKVLEFLHD